MTRLGALIGLLGGIAAVVSVVMGYNAIGADPLYEPRWGFGAAALVLGVVAGLSGLFPRLHAGAAAVVMFVAGVLGFLCTLVWYLNTWYVVALPLWLLGALLLLLGALSERPAARTADTPRRMPDSVPDGVPGGGR
ncbi:MAG TPA: hypothetical protein VJQ45_06565 [Ktedonobacterales bacterium]|nr:hypothetical protein [Ktedonobacterales bacterium]